MFTAEVIDEFANDFVQYCDEKKKIGLAIDMMSDTHKLVEYLFKYIIIRRGCDIE